MLASSQGGFENVAFMVDVSWFRLSSHRWETLHGAAFRTVKVTAKLLGRQKSPALFRGGARSVLSRRSSRRKDRTTRRGPQAGINPLVPWRHVRPCYAPPCRRASASHPPCLGRRRAASSGASDRRGRFHEVQLPVACSLRSPSPRSWTLPLLPARNALYRVPPAAETVAALPRCPRDV